MIFQAPNLKILDLEFTTVNDRVLYTISKTCSGLLQLILANCFDCTEIGVKHVIENCTQLKEIDLRGCIRVHTNVFASMLSLKSLRKITAAPHFHFTEAQRKLFFKDAFFAEVSSFNS
jgi:F-box/leucine-rich repeat protein 2/20